MGGKIKLKDSADSSHYIIEAPSDDSNTHNFKLVLPKYQGDPGEVLYVEGKDDDGSEFTTELGFKSTVQFLYFGNNGALTNTSFYELKTVNGSQNGQGWRMPTGGTVK